MTGRPFSRRAVLGGAVASATLAVGSGLLTGETAWAAEPSSARGGHRGLSGPSIQLDPTFPYYQGRSPDSIADELAVNGYRIVHYFVVNEQDVNGPVVEALRRRGITVWAMVIGNGSYSVSGFPDDWPTWQMRLLKPVDDGFYRFSPFSTDYLGWKKQVVAKLVSEYPFDGFEVAEPYFPEWNGLASGVYGDVGPLAQDAFMRRYGMELPDFTDPSSPRYYKTDTERYAKWMQLRVDAVNGFLAELVNGSGGVREARPDILVGTWSLGVDAGPESVALEREYQGLDAAAMISAVRPDIHILQTNWPDWTRPDLPATYLRTYRPFIDQIRATHPRIPLGAQTDIGSTPAMTRDDGWLRTFADTADQLGLATWTGYEYHLGGYIYHDRPVPRHVERVTDDSAVISFQKRIDPASAKLPQSFEILGGRRRFVDPSAVSVDGNRVTVGTLPRRAPVRLRVANLTDQPSTWLYHKDGPANAVPDDLVVDVPPAGR
ncbi:hypothetical protein [Actinopolymorpha rutila]|uniref:N-acyl-D-glucosamine 2-epimerase n=1 Tax=Actinopolymorpha rutila TaxID=446787 RepID=A0A852ZLC3_9ACTN|nr:hypothetical protein [Actinopolymorpha rutila]NYH92412.1 hypothetical protein [Actinopolymorpha rutila]